MRLLLCVSACVLAGGLSASGDSLPSETPKPLHAPPTQRQLNAMKERLNGLQRQINEVKGVTDCIIGTVAIAGDADSGFLTWGDSAKGDQIFPVIDPACV